MGDKEMRDIIISKELLIAVLGSEYNQRLVDWFQIEEDNFLRTYYDCGSFDDKGRPTGLGLEINIYEFAHKCKEWVLSKGYSQLSGKDDIYEKGEGFVCSVGSTTLLIKDFYADTELEAILKACEWVLELKK